MMLWHANCSKKGQMKIQEMSFVLIAIMILFGIAGLIFLRATMGNLQEQVNEQRAAEASEIVRKIAQTPEFSFTSFGDCSYCVDADKAIEIKNKTLYKGFFNLDYLQFEIRYPKREGECSKANFPDCATITVIGNNATLGGEVKSAFVALCRVDFQSTPYKRCDLGMVHAAGKSLSNYLQGGNSNG